MVFVLSLYHIFDLKNVIKVISDFGGGFLGGFYGELLLKVALKSIAMLFYFIMSV
jgi:hypothetical protein